MNKQINTLHVHLSAQKNQLVIILVRGMQLAGWGCCCAHSRLMLSLNLALLLGCTQVGLPGRGKTFL